MQEEQRLENGNQRWQKLNWIVIIRFSKTTSDHVVLEKNNGKLTLNCSDIDWALFFTRISIPFIPIKTFWRYTEFRMTTSSLRSAARFMVKSTDSEVKISKRFLTNSICSSSIDKLADRVETCRWFSEISFFIRSFKALVFFGFFSPWCWGP